MSNSTLMASRQTSNAPPTAHKSSHRVRAFLESSEVPHALLMVSNNPLHTTPESQQIFDDSSNRLFVQAGDVDLIKQTDYQEPRRRVLELFGVTVSGAAPVRGRLLH